MKLVHIGGAKGVGKSTVLSIINNPKVRVISMSSLLYKIASETYHKKWSDIVEDQRCQIRKKAIINIADLQFDIVILDSHYIDMRNGYAISIFPYEIQNLVNMHLVMESTPSEIYQRRVMDNKVQRNLSICEIEVEVLAERNLAMQVAHQTNTLFQIINNENPVKTAESISSLIDLTFPIFQGGKCDGN